MSPKLPQMLQDDPAIGLEISDTLTQLKVLDISDSARLMMTTFEKFFTPMLANIECMKENEQLVEAKQAFVKENLEVVVQAHKEINGIMAMIEQKQQELSPKRKRAAEIRSRIADLSKEIFVLNEELEATSAQEVKINEVITPAQAQVNKMTMDAAGVSSIISTIETEIITLKAKAETFEDHALRLLGELRSF